MCSLLFLMGGLGEPKQGHRRLSCLQCPQPSVGNFQWCLWNHFHRRIHRRVSKCDIKLGTLDGKPIKCTSTLKDFGENEWLNHKWTAPSGSRGRLGLLGEIRNFTPLTPNGSPWHRLSAPCLVDTELPPLTCPWWPELWWGDCKVQVRGNTTGSRSQAEKWSRGFQENSGSLHAAARG